MEIRQAHKNVLETHARRMKREPGGMVFGPGKRGDFDDLRQVLDTLGVGYFGSYASEATEKSGLPDKVLINVLHNQAKKLSEILRQMELKSELDFLKSQQDLAAKEEEIEQAPIPSPQVQSKPNRWKSLVKSK